MKQAEIGKKALEIKPDKTQGSKSKTIAFNYIRCLTDRLL